MKNLNLRPPGMGPGKRKVTAAEVNKGATDKGLRLAETPEGDEVADRLFEKAAPRPDALKHGKYEPLGLFEEGETVDGVRTLRYRKGANRQYNDEAIKQNILPYYLKQNPGAKLRFDFAYGGTMKVNPLKPIK